MLIKEKILYCTSYRQIRNCDSSVRQNFNNAFSGRHIDICVEISCGMTMGIQTAVGKGVGALSEMPDFFKLTIFFTTENELCSKSSK